MPLSFSATAKVSMSSSVSAAFLPSRLSSCTGKLTGVSGAASLNWRASASAFSSSGRTLTRVLICSLKTLWHSARWRASSWLAS